jgi:flagellar biosynthesis/type III secretory pathway protein FliH
MNTAKQRLEELKSKIESRLHREFTETEIEILKLAYEEGREEGREAQKEYILSIITDRA